MFKRLSESGVSVALTVDGKAIATGMYVHVQLLV